MKFYIIFNNRYFYITIKIWYDEDLIKNENTFCVHR